MGTGKTHIFAHGYGLHMGAAVLVMNFDLAIKLERLLHHRRSRPAGRDDEDRLGGHALRPLLGKDDGLSSKSRLSKGAIESRSRFRIAGERLIEGFSFLVQRAAQDIIAHIEIALEREHLHGKTRKPPAQLKARASQKPFQRREIKIIQMMAYIQIQVSADSILTIQSPIMVQKIFSYLTMLMIMISGSIYSAQIQLSICIQL